LTIWILLIAESQKWTHTPSESYRSEQSKNAVLFSFLRTDVLSSQYKEDLRAAQAQGMQAAFVPRPLEQGPSHLPDLTPDPAWEVVVTDFMDLAQQLGAG